MTFLTNNLIARLLYGCGLRVSEPLNLRIKDVNLERSCLCIRGAKGGNDRVVPLPSSLVSEVVQQMECARLVWQRDKQDGVPVMLSQQLARKYPEYQFSWPWAWLFPAHHTCRDPRSGAVVRYRIVSCRRRGIDPWEYVGDVLKRLPGMKHSEVPTLLPRCWKPDE